MPAKRIAKKKPAATGEKPVKKAKKPSAPRIHSAMNVMEIIALHPGAAEVMSTYGLHCVGCAFNTLDTLHEGALSHGLSEHDVELIVGDLNDLLAKEAPRPSTLVITTAAAKALAKVAAGEGKTGYGLRVDTDEHGAFCMEFEPKAKSDDATFSNREVPELLFFASPLTLWKIGGSTIDHRDGRFKLDLPAQACGCGKETCGCGGNCAKH
ncbi:MAG TPA: hypothetical protein PKV72_04825 [Candidatus Peribacteria bacterium]|nr:hypothetical protein [Candidatus Peribacteria bacterium]